MNRLSIRMFSLSIQDLKTKTVYSSHHHKQRMFECWTYNPFLQKKLLELRGEESFYGVAKATGISRGTIYRYE